MVTFKKTFDKNNIYWSEDSRFAELFLLGIQKRFNDDLEWFDTLVLMSVYEAMGFETTKESCMHGWTKKLGMQFLMDWKRLDDGSYEIVFKCIYVLPYLPEEKGA